MPYYLLKFVSHRLNPWVTISIRIRHCQGSQIDLDPPNIGSSIIISKRVAHVRLDEKCMTPDPRTVKPIPNQTHTSYWGQKAVYPSPV